MYCALVVSNSIVRVGQSCSNPGARLKTGGGQQRFSSSSIRKNRGDVQGRNTIQSVSRHAEMDALRWLRRRPAVRKVRLVILRFKKHPNGRQSSGDAPNFGDSRPCYNCAQRIVRYYPNVTSVTFYENGLWKTEHPSACAAQSVLCSADRHIY